MVDLGHWLSEDYTVPAEVKDDQEKAGEDDESEDV